MIGVRTVLVSPSDRAGVFHYFACLTMVHLEAKAVKLEGVATELIPKIGRVIATTCMVFT